MNSETPVKTIGLLGGMSWQSSQHYYAQINQLVVQRLGGLHSAKIAMVSLDFAPIARLQEAEDWKAMASILTLSAQQIASAGADCLLICTNTMHAVADDVAAAVDIPLNTYSRRNWSTVTKRRCSKSRFVGHGFYHAKSVLQRQIAGSLSARSDGAESSPAKRGTQDNLRGTVPR